ncbi:hypothetical protein BC940DRAFT_316026 [Gongronella butleri]|nr:hypothetical protein BC940DRAFT_316026 [Gongronella butleri]
MSFKHPLRELIKKRLENSRLKAPIDPSVFLDKLARRKDDDNFLDYLMDFADDSATVNDDGMAFLFLLKKCVKEPVFLSRSSITNFYVRSLAFVARELRAIMDGYDRLYHDPEFVAAWRAKLADMGDDEPVWLRYVGCTSRSAAQREQEDRADVVRAPSAIGRKKVIKSRYMNVISVVDSLFPNRSTDMAIFELPELQVALPQTDPKRDELVDATEQFLVHLFDRGCLLNSQPGGLYSSYLPLDDDVECIRGLNLPLTDQLGVRDVAEIDLLKKKLKAIYETPSHPFGMKKQPALLDMTIEQALGIYNDAPPRRSTVLILGKDITHQNATQATKFFDQSRSGKLTSDAIKEVYGTNDKDTRFHLPPMIDLHCTLVHKYLDADIYAAAKVIQAVKPVIVPCLGELPTKVAYGQFQNTYGLPDGSYNASMATPVIVNEDADFDLHSPADEVPQDLHCIVLPCVDPGNVKYGSGCVLTLRFIQLFWARVALLKACADKIVAAAGGIPLMTRSQCEEIYAAWEVAEKASGLGERLEEAHEAYSAAYSSICKGRADKTKSRAGAPTEEKAAAVVAGNKKRMQQQQDLIGVAQGVENSEERAAQRAYLRRLNLPMLRVHPLYADEEKWGAWLLGLRKGADILHTTIYEAKVSKSPPTDTLSSRQVTYYKSLSKRFGMDSDDPSSYETEEAQKLLKRHWLKDILEKSSKKKRKAPLKVNEKDAFEFFLDAKVSIGKNHVTKFRVLIDDEVQSERDGLYTSSLVPQGDYFLHVDPAVTTRGILIKNMATKEYLKDRDNKPIIISDMKILKSGESTYFAAFKNTLEHLGHQVDESFRNLRPWNKDRVGRLLWRHYCSDGPWKFRTNPDAPASVCFQKCVERVVRGLDLDVRERDFWFPSTKQGMSQIHKYLGVLAPGFSTYRDDNYYFWILPKYQEEQVGDEEE